MQEPTPQAHSPTLHAPGPRRLLMPMRAVTRHRLRHFASDNNAGLCPEVLSALTEANLGHCPGYGDDPWTARACALIREFFETECQVFFVFNGTAANALSLAAACQSFHSVLCHELSHVRHDECNAPGFFGGGLALHPLPGNHGRIRPASVSAAVRDHFPLHSSKPRALSLTQVTECGTVYSPRELSTLCRRAHDLGLRVHLDGARFSNAVAALQASPADLSWRAGIDLLSLGMTKNGGLDAEAIVVFDPTLAQDLEYRIKQAGQLASKMRFHAASWIGLLGTGAWLKNAQHANRMAARLSKGLQRLPHSRLLHPTQANGVFIDLPARVIRGLHRLGWHFYIFEGETGCRLMCSWDTSLDDIDSFLADAARLVART